MDINNYYELLDLSQRRVNSVNTDIKRPLLNEIDFRDRLICIKGSRGVGKTTLLLQHIKETFASDNKALYISLDNLFFINNDVNELIDYHVKNGGTHIFIDEIHYYSNWQILIKNLYDNYPSLHIVYTGSSLLKLEKGLADLSRRQITYELKGLSFREYLIFENIIEINKISLEELLNKHEEIAREIISKTSILNYFNDYLKKGYYPFYKEIYSGYETRIMQTINQILENDYMAYENISNHTIMKIKKMLYILAISCPQTPNMSELYSQLETDRNQGIKMLKALDKANLLNLLFDEKHKLKNLPKPTKIYLDNTNLMYALNNNIDIGTKRETFFLNQIVNSNYEVIYPNSGDFLVDNKYLFEVGGKNKNFSQIKDIQNSYLVVDDIEIGRGNKIPLWMFGLLY